MLSFDDFSKIELKTAKILEVENHPQADRLLVLKVDVGEEAPRTIVAGIKEAFKPLELLGRQIVLVSNLEPAIIRGVESQGMLLASKDGGKMALITPDKLITPGSKVS